jgi:hypothetical protein
MTYFEDLSQYTYRSREEGVVNVGWLKRKHPFPTGVTSEEFRLKLGRLCQHSVHLYFGFHECEFCTGRNRPDGNGEIRVSGVKAAYAAPALIHHYVKVHAYLPPDDFVAAVLASGGTDA